MAFIQNLFFSIFFWVFFILSFSYFLFFFPLIFLYGHINKRKEEVFQHLLKKSFKLFFLTMENFIPNLKITIEEKEKLSQLKSTVIMCNHISYLDGILIASIIPNMRAITKSIYFKIPVLSSIINHAGFISSDVFIDHKKLKGLAEKFENGSNLLIFPEGSRSKDGKLKPFFKGGFSLAIMNKRPIELLYIKNTDLYLGRNNRVLYDTVHKVEFKLKTIGKIEVTNKKLSDSKKMKDQVFNLYSNIEKESVV